MTALTFFPLLSEGVELQKLFAQNPGGLQSGSATAIASSGTITTSGPPQISVARVNPAAAVTGVILQPGTSDGQQLWVVNEATNAAYTITFAASGTSNVADGTSDVIQANQGRLYVWDSAANSGNGYWYSTPQIINTVSLTQSGSAAATASSGTITTAGVQVARVSPAGAINGVIMQAGTIAGQLCLVVNEAVIGNSVQMAAAGTSNVADGVNCIIPGLQAQLFIWDSAQSLWYKPSPGMVAGALAPIISATAANPGATGTVATAGIGVSRVSNSTTITAGVLQAGTYPGQEVWVVNEHATHTITWNTTPGTSNIADSATEAAIAALTARKYVWNGTAWYPGL